jgi:hypothetical protein
MALLEANRQRGTEEGVSQWDFDDAGGRISARDNDGNLVMAFEVGPLFGPRLAAAFGYPGTTALAGTGDNKLRTRPVSINDDEASASTKSL